MTEQIRQPVSIDPELNRDFNAFLRRLGPQMDRTWHASEILKKKLKKAGALKREGSLIRTLAYSITKDSTTTKAEFGKTWCQIEISEPITDNGIDVIGMTAERFSIGKDAGGYFDYDKGVRYHYNNYGASGGILVHRNGRGVDGRPVSFSQRYSGLRADAFIDERTTQMIHLCDQIAEAIPQPQRASIRRRLSGLLK